MLPHLDNILLLNILSMPTSAALEAVLDIFAVHKSKGALGSKCQTGTRLVSPTRGHKKKEKDLFRIGLLNVNLRLIEPFYNI